MRFDKVPLRPGVARFNRKIEAVANAMVRRVDGTKQRFRLGGRAASYDDANYEFVGGASDVLRKKHYDKSLRLLWKAEKHAPWLSFADNSKAERELEEMALRSMTDEVFLYCRDQHASHGNLQLVLCIEIQIDC